MDSIRIRGARTHNLKNLNLDRARHRLIVITGWSGSGKSWLAFDTLYAEGQRRYVESLSAYARQFLQLMEKPDVDLIVGLSPAISIEQKAASHNPRSTVGTITEIHDYLRLLYARVGTPYCPEHKRPLQAHPVSQMVEVDHALIQAHWLLPRVRRHGNDHVLRSQARGRAPGPVPRERRDQGLGPAQPVLFPDAHEPRRAFPVRRRGAVRETPGAGPDARAPRHAGKDPVLLPERARPHAGEGARLRRHPAQPRAPLQGDRFSGRARGAREIPEHQGLPLVRGNAPSPGGAAREDRRPRDFRGERFPHEAGARILPPARAIRREAGDRRENRQRDHRAAQLPQQRRP